MLEIYEAYIAVYLIPPFVWKVVPCQLVMGTTSLETVTAFLYRLGLIFQNTSYLLSAMCDVLVTVTSSVSYIS